MKDNYLSLLATTLVIILGALAFLTPNVIALGTWNITEVTLFNISGCMNSPNDMSISSELERAYIWGSEGVNRRVMIVDISDVNNPSQTACVNFGATSAPHAINLLNSAIDGIDAFLGLGAFGNARLVNVTNSGDSLATAYQTGGGEVIELQSFNDFDTENSNVFLGCQRANREVEFYSGFSNPPTTITLFTINGSATCNGLSRTALGNAVNGRFITVEVNEGYKLHGKGVGEENIQSEPLVQSAGVDNTEILTSSMFSVTMSQFHLNTYDIGTDTFTLEDSLGAISGLSIGGSAFLTNESAVLSERNSSDNSLNLVYITFEDLSTIVQNDSFITHKQNMSVGTATVEYSFPHIYVLTSSNYDYLGIYLFSPESLQAGENIKPEITTHTSDVTEIITGNTATISYSIINPETDTIGENILVNTNCEYSETEILNEDFTNFTDICSTGSIGARKGVDFSTGLDTSTCSADNLLLNQLTTANTIGSFDIFATNNGTAFLELITFSGDEIVTFSLAYSNTSEWTLHDVTNNQVILSGLTGLANGADTPTRFYFNLNPTATNSNRVNKVFWATNYFALNSEIGRVFCDSAERCYIGDFTSISANPMTDFFGLRVHNASSNLLIDNYRIATTNRFTDYTSTTTLSSANLCTYSTNGVKEVRTYTSDTTYDHNYLYFENLSIIVSSSGLIGSETGINSTLKETFDTLIAVAGGEDSESKQIIAWFIIVISLLAGVFIPAPAVAKVIYALMLGIGELALFTILGWIPIIWTILIIIFAGALVSIAVRRGFTTVG